jgi:hypothetical protein
LGQYLALPSLRPAFSGSQLDLVRAR